MAETLNFRVSSGLKDIIGKDLITDDYVAVFELVKNSYDAKATKVIITFEQDKIIIADNGKGMSNADINEKWLFVAYSAKKDGTEDKSKSKTTKKNYYAGAKGIGRFSSDRLGKILVVTTKTINAKKCENITVNWQNFEKNQNDDFININVEYEQKLNKNIFPNNSKQGTILEINKLNTTWTREKIKELKHSLEKLINPFSKPNDFSIEIVCLRELINDKKEEYEREKINGIIENSILEIIKLKTTKIDAKITSKEIRTEIIDRGEVIYRIKEENKNYSLLNNVLITIYYLNQKSKANFTKLMHIQPVKYGSIFLFKNGFRVYPFGNKGDDSWGLDYRAQQRHSSRLSTRDLFGKVEITTNNTQEFKEVSSRDGGLVKTKGWFQLKAVFDKTHRYLERYVSGVLWGTDFLSEKYFENEQIAQENRSYLLDNDWVNEDISFIKKSIGSKIDYIQIIKGLIRDKNITIEYYNKDLLDIISERLNEIKPRFIKDLETIAEKTGNHELKGKIFLAEKEISKLKAENEKKEKELVKEKGLRKKAEEKAKKAKEAQQKAEEKYQQAEDSRQQYEEEVNIRKQQTYFLEAALTIDERTSWYNTHVIKGNAEDIAQDLKNILKKHPELKNEQEFHSIAYAINKIIMTVKNFNIINYDFKRSIENEDLGIFIEQYFKSIPVNNTLKIEINNTSNSVLRFPYQDVTMMLYNIVTNSKKANATKLTVEIYNKDEYIILKFIDDGDGIKNNIKLNELFDLGLTYTHGTGIGLAQIKDLVENQLGGTVTISRNKIKGVTLEVMIPNENTL
jgi:signal transduction histidine kinase